MQSRLAAYALVSIALLGSLGTACAATVSAPGSAAPGDRSFAVLLQQVTALPLNAWAGLPIREQRLAGPLEPEPFALTEDELPLLSEAVMLTNPDPGPEEQLGVCILFVLAAGGALRFLISPTCRQLVTEVYYPRNY